MTLMLASVTGTVEAEIALAGGADIIDLKDPSRGALGALPPEIVRDTVKAIRGRRPISVVTGDLPMQPKLLFESASAMAETGAEYIKIGFFPSATAADCVRALDPLHHKTHLIGVLFADLDPDLSLLPLMSGCGFKGVMLDTAKKGHGRLLDHMDISILRVFVEKCREAQLLSGLAGSLELPDIARLLLLDPSLLGFRGALCESQRRSGSIDAERVNLVRALMPREIEPGGKLVEPKIDWRFLAARGYSGDPARSEETDRIFVHDLIMPVSIGAYDFERQKTQRVRFNIDVDIRRLAYPAEDMRDVFSYDLIVDAIRLVLSRGHIQLVETLAEEIADAVLAHRRVMAMKIRVEKLDVVEGSVGVEITRERAKETASVRRLFSPFTDVTGSNAGG